MSTTTEPRQTKPSLRAEEPFWQRYSPHHEFPLATVSAVTLCGLALGVLVLIWLWNFGLSPELGGPPGSDAVAVEGGGGPGMDGAGTGTTSLGKNKTELAANDVKTTPGAARRIEPAAPLKELKASPLEVPSTKDDEKGLETNPFQPLINEATQAEIEERIQAERKAAQRAKVKAAKDGSGGPPGGKNGPGSGGGPGIGFGPDDGPGTGSKGGGPRGWRAPTIQEVHSRRWKIFLSPDIDLHLRTLIAMRATYIFRDDNKRYFQVQDLKRTPVELTPIPPVDSKNVVAWGFEDRRILGGLAQKLGVRFWPAQGIITLPAEVEQNLAAVEQEAMQKAGRTEQTVRYTHFDVRFKNGAYEPYVTGFE